MNLPLDVLLQYLFEDFSPDFLLTWPIPSVVDFAPFQSLWNWTKGQHFCWPRFYSLRPVSPFHNLRMTTIRFGLLQNKNALNEVGTFLQPIDLFVHKPWVSETRTQSPWNHSSQKSQPIMNLVRQIPTITKRYWSKWRYKHEHDSPRINNPKCSEVMNIYLSLCGCLQTQYSLLAFTRFILEDFGIVDVIFYHESRASG